MKAAQTKITLTMDPYLAQWLDLAAKTYGTPKSVLLKKAVEVLKEKMLEEEGKKIASMQIDDPAIEKAWLDMNDLDPKLDWRD